MSNEAYWHEKYLELLNQKEPQRTWVGLTPENYNEIFKQARTGEHAVQLAEAKLKDKNYQKGETD